MAECFLRLVPSAAWEQTVVMSKGPFTQTALLIFCLIKCRANFMSNRNSLIHNILGMAYSLEGVTM
jgi:hypothetical protein